MAKYIKEKNALWICSPRQCGKTMLQLQHIITQGVTKIIVEESNLREQRDALLKACEETQKAFMLLYECNKDVEIALGSGLQIKKAEGLVKSAIATAKK